MVAAFLASLHKVGCGLACPLWPGLPGLLVLGKHGLACRVLCFTVHVFDSLPPELLDKRASSSGKGEGAGLRWPLLSGDTLLGARGLLRDIL